MLSVAQSVVQPVFRYVTDEVLAYMKYPLPGEAGFGVGICPNPPASFTYLGDNDPHGAWFGNYEHTAADGISKSLMVWVPAYWLRIGHPSSPVYAKYGSSSFDMLPMSAFKTEAAANAQGYFRHRALIDGGQVKDGFFKDKTHCSASAGGVAVSVPMAPPLSSHSTHNPFSSVGAANTFGGALTVAKTRGSDFFPAGLFICDYLACISQAHGQHATGTENCAWWAATGVSAPRGNNVNGALRDVNDASVTFISDGYGGGSSALTMSGSNLAKTTHNGQKCGIADVNGNMWNICPGITTENVVSIAITGATKANPCALTTSAPHNLTNGKPVDISGIVGMTELNNRIFTATVINPTTFSINVDSSGFAAYTSGGTARHGNFFILKNSVRMAELTGGYTLATDAWGAAGVAANYDPLDMVLKTTYPNNGYGQAYGVDGQRTFSGATSGTEWLKSCAGIPLEDGVSPSGTNIFGNDYYYQAIVNQMCPIRGGYWSSGAGAGVWAVHWSTARGNSSTGVGVALALYL